MSQPLLLIPLDDRPATYHLPRQIGAIASLDVECPPLELMGNLERPADCDALLAWLAERAPEAQGAILSVDTLGYGGLIPSRQADTPLPVIQQRLAGLVKIKEAKPTLPLYGFSVTMRLSAEAAVEEEKPYWAEYGRLIYRYSYHQDKYEQQGDAVDLQAALDAKGQIPFEVLSDYMETRERNFAINQMMVEWTRRNLFDMLLMTQDDTSRFGLNVKEQRKLVEQVTATNLSSRVLVYPGADEVASVLVGRHLNRVKRQSPAFFVRYSTPYGGTITPMYEDRPLERTVASQIQAVGGRVVGSMQEADVLLMVNTPASGQGDLALRIHLDKVDNPPRDLAPFARTLAESLVPTALADVAYANGGDPELFRAFKDHLRLCAFAAWNTAGNTLGTVVAQASAWLDPATRDEAAQRQYMLDRIADDLLYQSQLRPQLQEERAKGRSVEELEQELPGRLLALWSRLVHRIRIAAIEARFPWHRLFEVGVHVVERQPGDEDVPSTSQDQAFEAADRHPAV